MKKSVVVISGEYKGRTGIADFTNTKKTGNVMFYPVEGIHPYRVCLDEKSVREVDYHPTLA